MKKALVLLAVLASFFLIPLMAHAQAQITAEQLEKIRGRKVTAAEVKEANDLMRKWTEYYKVMDNRRFHIKGEVVDEQGARLTGVTMWVTKAVPGGWWQEVQYVSKEYTINGTFEVRERGCEDISLTFDKGGYYRQSIRFSDDAKANTREIQERIMKGLPVEEPLVGKEGLRIVMEKKGEQVSLKNYGGPLEYKTTGQGTVQDFKNKIQAYSVSSVLDATSLPEGSVFIVADKDETGKIATVTLVSNGSKYIVPQRIRLIMNIHGDGGFILYEAKNTREPFHEMKQAPEKGYQKEVVLNGELLLFVASHSKDITFYFKTDKYYGKGGIGQIDIGKDNFSTKIWTGFFVQTNGSRNLESITPL